MAHENRAKLYDDWDQPVHCSFKNVFTRHIAEIVGRNIHQILRITHFRTEHLAQHAPQLYEFTCSRAEANSIRDHLLKVTTNEHSNVWFSMKKLPFHYIDGERSMLTTVVPKLKNYPVSVYFGSMFTYDTFNRYSEEHPPIDEISITSWRDEPETIRIMSKDKSRQIFIPIKWIQREILVHLKDQPYVVFMLKNSVKMKQRTMKEGQQKYERFCNNDDNTLAEIISKSSDLLLLFKEPEHTYIFLKELMKETGGYKNKFVINFVTLKQTSIDNSRRRLNLPATASHQQHYALHMLYSMGYVFQDKYSAKFHDEFIRFAKNEDQFNEICYYLKEKLQENHCYGLKMIFKDYPNYIQQKRQESSNNNTLSYKIGCVSLTPLRLVYQPMTSSIGNRVIRNPEFGGADNFLLVHIREEDNQPLKDFDSSVRRRLKRKMANGIQVMGKTYRLFGTSTSQMKEMSFWFLDLKNRSLEDAWKLLGDFNSIKNVAQYVARIGLFFSTARRTNLSFQYVEKILPNMKLVVTMIDDEEIPEKGYCFTDGIGKMSWATAALIAKQLDIPVQCKEDIPSAYQVRIAGCKGMLAIDPESNMDDSLYIKVRPSMRKFHSDNWELEICDHSRPLELRFNNQVIMLLSALGNTEACFAVYQNASINHEHEENEQERNRKMKYASAEDDLLRNRFPLPLDEARNMFGVVDETRTLKEKQVFIQYKNLDPKSDQEYIVVTGNVIVAKNPCLHPGDVRVFTAVDVPELRNCIRDCIVFPIKGSRPHPNELSGSDLDGDQYWVYWGKILKIKKMEDPLSYTPAKPIKVPTISPEMVIDHIVDTFGTGSQGIICDIHLAIAATNGYGVKSEECKRLAELFARAVDAPKTGEIIDLDEVYKLRAKIVKGYPYFMKKYDQPIVETTCVLDNLFLEGRRRFFEIRNSAHNAQPVHIRSRSASASSRGQDKRKKDTTKKDKEFLNWFASLDAAVLTNSAAGCLPIIKQPTAGRKPRTSLDVTNKSTNSVKSKEEEDKEGDTASMSSITSVKGRRGSTAVKPKETKAKPSVNFSSHLDGIPDRNIIFNGMTAVTNRLQWSESNDGFSMVDLDRKTPGENNGIDKLVQCLLDSAKTGAISKDNKLMLTISWGKLSLKLPQTIGNMKPKNIKEFVELIKQNNDVKFSFNATDIEKITRRNEPSSKSAVEYVLVCKVSDNSTEQISLIFNDKKVLKRLSVSTPWWFGCIRRDEQLMDTLYEVQSRQDEIDSKHVLFSQKLVTLFKISNSTSILSGKSPQITIETDLLQPNVRVVSLRKIIRCSYSVLPQRQFRENQFETFKDLTSNICHVTYISTEKTDEKIPTHETIEFHTEPIQVAKGNEIDLKALFSFIDNYFI